MGASTPRAGERATSALAPRRIAWPTKYDGHLRFYCLREGQCSGGDVIRCSWDGGHNWLFNDAKANGGLLTTFLLQWTKPTHVLLYGRTFEPRTTAP